MVEQVRHIEQDFRGQQAAQGLPNKGLGAHSAVIGFYEGLQFFLNKLYEVGTMACSGIGFQIGRVVGGEGKVFTAARLAIPTTIDSGSISIHGKLPNCTMPAIGRKSSSR